MVIYVVWIKSKHPHVPDIMVSLHRTKGGAEKKMKEFQETNDQNEYFVLGVILQT